MARRSASGHPRLGFLAGNRGGEEPEDNYLSHVTPEDLLEFGFIPELVGRLPITVSLESLNKDALVQVLTEPKNAIVKQYQQLFSIDGVALEFTPSALEAAAERALDHHTGARCLRYVIEETLLDVMYDLPSLPNVARCVVDADAIEGTGDPILLTQAGQTLNIPLGRMSQSA